MRQLTKAEIKDIETVKLDILSNIEFMGTCSDEEIINCLNQAKRLPMSLKNSLISQNINPESMNLEDYKRRAISAFIEYSLES